MKLRCAVTPNGLLHVGSARIVLANWLVARRHAAPILLRLDDADPERSRPEHADHLLHDLRWLGIEWDEEVRQSDRSERYAAAALRLEAAGRLYPCFESDEELNAKREQRQRRGQSPIYDRAMLKLTPAQRASAEAGGKRPYWRFRLQSPVVTWNDSVGGRRDVKLGAMSDPVLVRADGTPLPPFTDAVDDMELGTTHVVRAEDHLGVTGLQLEIMAALGQRPGAIRFAHLPALAAPEGGRLVRRDGLPSLRTLRTDGIEPAALAGYLARLGTDEDFIPEPPALLAPTYDPARVSRNAPKFDMKQLLALNRRALEATPFEAARDRLPPAATPAFWSAIRGKLDLLREARGWWDVVAGEIVPPLIEEDTAFLHRALELLPAEPWDDRTWPNWTNTIRQATGRKGKMLFLPLRLALTGEDQGPELSELLPLMGRARVAERLRLAAT